MLTVKHRYTPTHLDIPNNDHISVSAAGSPRHILAYIRGIICLTRRLLASLVDEPRDEVRKLQKVCHAHERAPPTDNELRLRRDDVCPMRRYRANPILIDAQQESHPVRAVSLADTDEASPA